MIRVLIAGGRGSIGQNLRQHLAERQDCETRVWDADGDLALGEPALWADVIFHLGFADGADAAGESAGVHSGWSAALARLLCEAGHRPKIVFVSATQGAPDDACASEAAGAEKLLGRLGEKGSACVRIYRLGNLFGKWCPPHPHSVAELCQAIARDLPVSLDDPNRTITLRYIDDAVAAFLNEIDSDRSLGDGSADIPAFTITRGELAGRIQAFHEMNHTLALPDFADPFNRALYATYLTYVPEAARAYGLDIKCDARGSLAEFIRQGHFGQVFVSRSRPGVTRGNHYHHTKAEKFLVVEGEGLIRMRPVDGQTIAEYNVTGGSFRVVDIPPGLTHAITNTGGGDMVTLFWSSIPFDPNHPDTYYLPVEQDARCGAAAGETVRKEKP